MQSQGSSRRARLGPGLLALAAVVNGLVLVAASGMGLLYRERVYPSPELAQNFVATDVATALVTVPLLLAAVWAAWRGSRLGWLCWPGALLAVAYNSLIYLLVLPLSGLYLLHLAAVALSLYPMGALLATQEGDRVRRELAGLLPEAWAAMALTGFGGLFLLRTGVELASGLADPGLVSRAELGLWAADFLLTPAWLVGGVLIGRRHAWGYRVAPGLLYQGLVLFAGLIVYLLLAPLLTGAAFAPLDLGVILLFSLLFVLPLGRLLARWRRRGPAGPGEADADAGL